MAESPKSAYQNACTSGTADDLRGAVSSGLDLAPQSLRVGGHWILAPLDPQPPHPHTHFDRHSKDLSR